VEREIGAVQHPALPLSAPVVPRRRSLPEPSSAGSARHHGPLPARCWTTAAA